MQKLDMKEYSAHNEYKTFHLQLLNCFPDEVHQQDKVLCKQHNHNKGRHQQQKYGC